MRFGDSSVSRLKTCLAVSCAAGCVLYAAVTLRRYLHKPTPPPVVQCPFADNTVALLRELHDGPFRFGDPTPVAAAARRDAMRRLRRQQAHRRHLRRKMRLLLFRSQHASQAAAAAAAAAAAQNSAQEKQDDDSSSSTLRRLSATANTLTRADSGDCIDVDAQPLPVSIARPHKHLNGTNSDVSTSGRSAADGSDYEGRFAEEHRRLQKKTHQRHAKAAAVHTSPSAAAAATADVVDSAKTFVKHARAMLSSPVDGVLGATRSLTSSFTTASDAWDVSDTDQRRRLAGSTNSNSLFPSSDTYSSSQTSSSTFSSAADTYTTSPTHTSLATASTSCSSVSVQDDDIIHEDDDGYGDAVSEATAGSVTTQEKMTWSSVDLSGPFDAPQRSSSNLSHRVEYNQSPSRRFSASASNATSAASPYPQSNTSGGHYAVPPSNNNNNNTTYTTTTGTSSSHRHSCAQAQASPQPPNGFESTTTSSHHHHRSPSHSGTYTATGSYPEAGFVAATTTTTTGCRSSAGGDGDELYGHPVSTALYGPPLFATEMDVTDALAELRNSVCYTTDRLGNSCLSNVHASGGNNNNNSNSNTNIGGINMYAGMSIAGSVAGASLLGGALTMSALGGGSSSAPPQLLSSGLSAASPPPGASSSSHYPSFTASYFAGSPSNASGAGHASTSSHQHPPSSSSHGHHHHHNNRGHRSSGQGGNAGTQMNASAGSTSRYPSSAAYPHQRSSSGSGHYKRVSSHTSLRRSRNESPSNSQLLPVYTTLPGAGTVSGSTPYSQHLPSAPQSLLGGSSSATNHHHHHSNNNNNNSSGNSNVVAVPLSRMSSMLRNSMAAQGGHLAPMVNSFHSVNSAYRVYGHGAGAAVHRRRAYRLRKWFKRTRRHLRRRLHDWRVATVDRIANAATVVWCVCVASQQACVRGARQLADSTKTRTLAVWSRTWQGACGKLRRHRRPAVGVREGIDATHENDSSVFLSRRLHSDTANASHSNSHSNSGPTPPTSATTATKADPAKPTAADAKREELKEQESLDATTMEEAINKVVEMLAPSPGRVPTVVVIRAPLGYDVSNDADSLWTALNLDSTTFEEGLIDVVMMEELKTEPLPPAPPTQSVAFSAYSRPGSVPPEGVHATAAKDESIGGSQERAGSEAARPSSLPHPLSLDSAADIAYEQQQRQSTSRPSAVPTPPPARSLHASTPPAKPSTAEEKKKKKADMRITFELYPAHIFYSSIIRAAILQEKDLALRRAAAELYGGVADLEGINNGRGTDPANTAAGGVGGGGAGIFGTPGSPFTLARAASSSGIGAGQRSANNSHCGLAGPGGASNVLNSVENYCLTPIAPGHFLRAPRSPKLPGMHHSHSTPSPGFNSCIHHNGSSAAVGVVGGGGGGGSVLYSAGVHGSGLPMLPQSAAAPPFGVSPPSSASNAGAAIGAAAAAASTSSAGGVIPSSTLSPAFTPSMPGSASNVVVRLSSSYSFPALPPQMVLSPLHTPHGGGGGGGGLGPMLGGMNTTGTGAMNLHGVGGASMGTTTLGGGGGYSSTAGNYAGTSSGGGGGNAGASTSTANLTTARRPHTDRYSAAHRFVNRSEVLLYIHVLRTLVHDAPIHTGLPSCVISDFGEDDGVNTSGSDPMNSILSAVHHRSSGHGWNTSTGGGNGNGRGSPSASVRTAEPHAVATAPRPISKMRASDAYDDEEEASRHRHPAHENDSEEDNNSNDRENNERMGDDGYSHPHRAAYGCHGSRSDGAQMISNDDISADTKRNEDGTDDADGLDERAEEAQTLLELRQREVEAPVLLRYRLHITHQGSRSLEALKRTEKYAQDHVQIWQDEAKRMLQAMPPTESAMVVSAVASGQRLSSVSTPSLMMTSSPVLRPADAASHRLPPPVGGYPATAPRLIQRTNSRFSGMPMLSVSTAPLASNQELDRDEDRDSGPLHFPAWAMEVLIRRESMRETLIRDLKEKAFRICSIPLPDMRVHCILPPVVPRYATAHARGFPLSKTFAEEVLSQQRTLQYILLQKEQENQRVIAAQIRHAMRRQERHARRKRERRAREEERQRQRAEQKKNRDNLKTKLRNSIGSPAALVSRVASMVKKSTSKEPFSLNATERIDMDAMTLATTSVTTQATINTAGSPSGSVPDVFRPDVRLASTQTRRHGRPAAPDRSGCPSPNSQGYLASTFTSQDGRVVEHSRAERTTTTTTTTHTNTTISESDATASGGNSPLQNTATMLRPRSAQLLGSPQPQQTPQQQHSQPRGASPTSAVGTAARGQRHGQLTPSPSQSQRRVSEPALTSPTDAEVHFFSGSSQNSVSFDTPQEPTLTALLRTTATATTTNTTGSNFSGSSSGSYAEGNSGPVPTVMFTNASTSGSGDHSQRGPSWAMPTTSLHHSGAAPSSPETDAAGTGGGGGGGGANAVPRTTTGGSSRSSPAVASLTPHTQSPQPLSSSLSPPSAQPLHLHTPPQGGGSGGGAGGCTSPLSSLNATRSSNWTAVHTATNANASVSPPPPPLSVGAMSATAAAGFGAWSPAGDSSATNNSSSGGGSNEQPHTPFHVTSSTLNLSALAEAGGAEEDESGGEDEEVDVDYDREGKVRYTAAGKRSQEKVSSSSRGEGTAAHTTTATTSGAESTLMSGKTTDASVPYAAATSNVSSGSYTTGTGYVSAQSYTPMSADRLQSSGGRTSPQLPSTQRAQPTPPQQPLTSRYTDSYADSPPLSGMHTSTATAPYRMNRSTADTLDLDPSTHTATRHGSLETGITPPVLYFTRPQSAVGIASTTSSSSHPFVERSPGPPALLVPISRPSSSDNGRVFHSQTSSYTRSPVMQDGLPASSTTSTMPAVPNNSMYGTFDAYYGHSAATPQAVLLRQQAQAAAVAGLASGATSPAPSLPSHLRKSPVPSSRTPSSGVATAKTTTSIAAAGGSGTINASTTTKTTTHRGGVSVVHVSTGAGATTAAEDLAVVTSVSAMSSSELGTVGPHGLRQSPSPQKNTSSTNTQHTSTAPSSTMQHLQPPRGTNTTTAAGSGGSSSSNNAGGPRRTGSGLLPYTYSADSVSSMYGTAHYPLYQYPDDHALSNSASNGGGVGAGSGAAQYYAVGAAGGGAPAFTNVRTPTSMLESTYNNSSNSNGVFNAVTNAASITGIYASPTSPSGSMNGVYGAGTGAGVNGGWGPAGGSPRVIDSPVEAAESTAAPNVVQDTHMNRLKQYNKLLSDLLGVAGGPMRSGISFYYTYGDATALLYNASIQAPSDEDILELLEQQQWAPDASQQAVDWDGPLGSGSGNPSSSSLGQNGSADGTKGGSLTTPGDVHNNSSSAKTATGSSAVNGSGAAASSSSSSTLNASRVPASLIGIGESPPPRSSVNSPTVGSTNSSHNSGNPSSSTTAATHGSSAKNDRSVAAEVPGDVREEEGCSYLDYGDLPYPEDSMDALEAEQIDAQRTRNKNFYSIFEHLHRAYHDAVFEPKQSPRGSMQSPYTASPSVNFSAAATARQSPPPLGGFTTTASFTGSPGSPHSATMAHSFSHGVLSAPHRVYVYACYVVRWVGWKLGVAATPPPLPASAVRGRRSCSGEDVEEGVFCGVHTTHTRSTNTGSTSNSNTSGAGGANSTSKNNSGSGGNGDGPDSFPSLSLTAQEELDAERLARRFPGERIVTFGREWRVASQLDMHNGHYGLSPLQVWMAARYSRRFAGEVYLMDVVAAGSDPYYPAVRVLDEVVAHAVLYYHNHSLRDFTEDLASELGLEYVPQTAWGRRALGLPVNEAEVQELDGLLYTAARRRQDRRRRAHEMKRQQEREKRQSRAASNARRRAADTNEGQRSTAGKKPRGTVTALGDEAFVAFGYANDVDRPSSATMLPPPQQQQPMPDSAVPDPATTAAEMMASTPKHETHPSQQTKSGSNNSEGMVAVAEDDGGEAMQNSREQSPITTSSQLLQTAAGCNLVTPILHKASTTNTTTTARTATTTAAAGAASGPAYGSAEKPAGRCSPSSDSGAERHRLNPFAGVDEGLWIEMQSYDQEEDEEVFYGATAAAVIGIGSGDINMAPHLYDAVMEREVYDERMLLRELDHLKDFLIDNRNVLSSAMLTASGSNALEAVFGVPATVFPFLLCARESVPLISSIFESLSYHYGPLTYDNFSKMTSDAFRADRPDVLRHTPRLFRMVNKSRRGCITYEELCGWLARKLSCGNNVQPNAHLMAAIMSLRLPLALVAESREDWGKQKCAMKSLSDAEDEEY